MEFHRKNLSDNELIHLYQHLLLPRMVEEKMLVLLRQGKISKWFSGIGQEAISVGTTLALQDDEYILPMHRNLGMFTARSITLESLFLQFQGKEGGFTKGRDRSFHFGSNPHHLVGMISHLGPQLAIADGIALATKLAQENKVTLVITGDGATSEGDFHEALNVASVWDLPVIFVIENNGYGLSTPSREQFRCEYISDKAKGYAMDSYIVDGNNLLEVYLKTKEIAEDLRKNPRPVMLECLTFRMRGHEEASGTKYVPQKLFEEWAKKDPIENFKQYLMREGVLDDSLETEIRTKFRKEIDEAVAVAFSAPEISVSNETELNDVYFPYTQKVKAPMSESTEMRMIDAISDGLKMAMNEFPNLVLMGQDIAEYGGAFKITNGFVEEFGKERVRNTPLCESAIVGTALGLSIKGYKAMVEMQFADFVTCGFNQIVNNLAKIHYRWGQNADVVVRMPTGAGVAAGPFHSQSNEAWFFHTPGLKIVYPSNPYDAKGLLLASFEDPNPVMFFEHKALYRSLSGNVPSGYYTEEIGKAKLVRKGSGVSIITYGMGVVVAQKYLDENPQISASVLDLRTLLPLDKEAIFDVVKNTGKVLILHEDTLTGGIASEISSIINENCFEYLDAPVVRLASMDTPIPFAPVLEQNFLPYNKLGNVLKTLISY
jgi:2-oxoisovalerate dehydrogenase E1 component